MTDYAVVNAPIQRRTSNIGLYDNLKSSIEDLSGLDMSKCKGPLQFLSPQNYILMFLFLIFIIKLELREGRISQRSWACRRG